MYGQRQNRLLNIVGMLSNRQPHRWYIRIGNLSCDYGTTFVFLSSLCNELLGSSAPKGQTIPAQRNALGLPSHTHTQALKGRPKTAPVGEEVKGKRLEARGDPAVGGQKRREKQTICLTEA
jgi:hypothetical protein